MGAFLVAMTISKREIISDLITTRFLKFLIWQWVEADNVGGWFFYKYGNQSGEKCWHRYSKPSFQLKK